MTDNSREALKKTRLILKDSTILGIYFPNRDKYCLTRFKEVQGYDTTKL